MKKKFSVAVLFLICCMLFSWRVVAVGDTDLPIYTQGIKEREHTDSALTDAYQINILTRESNEMQKKIKSQEMVNSAKLQQSLLTEQKEKEAFYVMVSEQAENMAIFSKPHMYSNIKPAAQNQTVSQVLLWSIVFIILGVISFLAALALQQRKRRKENVCNNYNETGRAVL